MFNGYRGRKVGIKHTLHSLLLLKHFLIYTIFFATLFTRTCYIIVYPYLYIYI